MIISVSRITSLRMLHIESGTFIHCIFIYIIVMFIKGMVLYIQKFEFCDHLLMSSKPLRLLFLHNTDFMMKIYIFNETQDILGHPLKIHLLA